MGLRRFSAVALVSAAVLITTGATAFAGALYDFSIFLGQPHPFAANGGTTTAPSATPGATAATMQYGAVQSPSAAAPSVEMSAVSSATGGDTFARFGERSDTNGGWGAISEIRGGVLNHDDGPFSRNSEEGNPDINAEILFVSPDILDIVWSPRPHIGADINTGGDTSQLYAGVSWEWFLWRNLFAGFSLGGAVHDGKKTMGAHNPEKLTRKELGCRLLFRESVEIGWMVTPNHGVSLMLDHISNARLCDVNQGLENFGVRYGYRF